MLRATMLMLVVATAAVAAEPEVEGVATKQPAVEFVKVTLKDGQVLRGQRLPSGEHQVVLKVGGGTMSLSEDQVATVEVERNVTVTDSGEVWRADPNRTRYFYAPSAMMLKQGEVTLSQKELVFTAVGVGATDWLSLQVGSVLPADFSAESFNFIGAVKVGGQVADRFHLAGGAQMLVLPGLGSGSGGFGVGFLFGAATYGTPDTHFTFAAGVPYAFGGGQGMVGDLLFTVNGNMRVTNNVALLTENWLMPSIANGDFYMANAAGVRLMGDHLAVDLGGIMVSSAKSGVVPFPVPWVDFTWNF